MQWFPSIKHLHYFVDKTGECISRIKRLDLAIHFSFFYFYLLILYIKVSPACMSLLYVHACDPGIP